MSRYPAFFYVLLFSVSALMLQCGGGGSTTPPPASGWTLSWSDEFNGADGSAPDSTKWGYDLGGGGWGNNELECYTNRLENAQVQGGNLVISTLHEPSFLCSDNNVRDYTSARLLTKGKFSQTYGRFEARIKIPAGQGMWPAFWMLGNNIDLVSWPACGEIDVMENIGLEPAKIYGSIHGPGYIGGVGLSQTYTLSSGNFSDDFHVYAVEWEKNIVRFYVDSAFYGSFTPNQLPQGAVWEFDHPFFLILNLAVGGDWPGPPDNTTVFPQTMLVDYVRVYTRSGS